MEITIIIICILLSAFFSGMEIAYVSSNKVYLSIEKNQHNFNSKILGKLVEKPSQFITSMLVGNNVVLVLYGIFSGDLLMKWIESFDFAFSPFTSLLLQTVFSTAIILMTAEFLPKVFFKFMLTHLLNYLLFLHIYSINSFFGFPSL